MKWLLIASALNLDVTYDTESTCKKAKVEIVNTYPEAKVLCIPAGMSKAESEVQAFMNMFDLSIKSKENYQRGQ